MQAYTKDAWSLSPLTTPQTSHVPPLWVMCWTKPHPAAAFLQPQRLADQQGIFVPTPDKNIHYPSPDITCRGTIASRWKQSWVHAGRSDPIRLDQIESPRVFLPIFRAWCVKAGSRKKRWLAVPFAIAIQVW